MSKKIRKGVTLPRILPPKRASHQDHRNIAEVFEGSSTGSDSDRGQVSTRSSCRPKPESAYDVLRIDHPPTPARLKSETRPPSASDLEEQMTGDKRVSKSGVQLLGPSLGPMPGPPSTIPPLLGPTRLTLKQRKELKAQGYRVPLGGTMPTTSASAETINSIANSEDVLMKEGGPPQDSHKALTETREYRPRLASSTVIEFSMKPPNQPLALNEIDSKKPHEPDLKGQRYTPYTLDDFRRIDLTVKVGTLGYVETAEKSRGRERQAKMRQYSAGVRAVNHTLQGPEPRACGSPPRPEQTHAAAVRQRALEFAARVPKPKAPGKAPPARATTPRPPTLLEALEAQHARDKEEVQAIRRMLRL